MFDTEKLIKKIKNYPCIWDVNSKEYKDMDLKRLTWRKVTEYVYKDIWPKLTESEKQDKIKEIKDKKWRHVRDSYKKFVSERRNNKIGSDANKKKTCAYAESLSFLSTTVRRRKTTTRNFETKENSSEEIETLDIQSDDSPRESPVNVSSSKASPHHYQISNKDTLIPFQNQLINGENELEDKNLDKNIVMSFLPYLKKINDEDKLDFHLNGLQYLKNIIQKQNLPTEYSKPQN